MFCQYNMHDKASEEVDRMFNCLLKKELKQRSRAVITR